MHTSAHKIPLVLYQGVLITLVASMPETSPFLIWSDGPLKEDEKQRVQGLELRARIGTTRTTQKSCYSAVRASATMWVLPSKTKSRQ